ncbi:MAG: SHOCT domain-containing protein [Chloroflexi bacterium]|nr:SHOCT domain-containing protein [Chloroflexota bacterium]
MPGLLRGVARTAVVAGTATAVSNRVSRRQAGRWADQEQQAYEQQAYQQAPPQYQEAPPQYQQAPPQYQQAPAYQEPPPPPPAPVVAVVQQPEEQDMSAKLAQLQQLGELKAQGILTDAEFEVQKQRILNS